jgi:hypothetical protein
MMVLRKWAHCLPAFRSVGPPFLRRLRSAGAFSGRNYMRSTATLISGLCLIFATAVAGQENSPTIAQSQTKSVKSLGVVQRGNTTIVFASSDNRDIDIARLRTWEDFADTHPGIARTLAYKPALMNDSRYLKGHVDLEAFFQAHPDIKSAM